jgi:ribosome-associated protein
MTASEAEEDPMARRAKTDEASPANDARNDEGEGAEGAGHRPRPVRGEAPSDPRTDDGGLDGAKAALGFALDKKALEPVLLDVRALCSYTNFQLVVSGRSDRQVDAIAEGIVSGLRAQGVRPLGTEGEHSGHWALLDFGDFLVHVFSHQVRDHYDLEGLWIDAPRVEIEVPAEARIQADEY